MVGLDMHPISEWKEGATGRSPVRRRRSIRLRGYDYSQAGAYFITICTQNRLCLFGEIVDGGMRLNAAGKMVKTVWDEIPAYYPSIDIDEFIVMPNHIHGIVSIVGAAPRGRPDPRGCGQAQGPAPTGGPASTRLSLPDVVHRFKTMTTKRYVDGVKRNDWPPFPGNLWQRNYWEHVVRNESELNRIREYIRHNPAKWQLDKLRPNQPPASTNIRESSATYERGLGQPTDRPYDWEEWMI
jgi:REP element-mobilizing transposase RayT